MHAGTGKVWLFDMNQRIRVAVADDNARIANLLEYELQKDDEIEFVGKTENGLEMLHGKEEYEQVKTQAIADYLKEKKT